MWSRFFSRPISIHKWIFFLFFHWPITVNMSDYFCWNLNFRVVLIEVGKTIFRVPDGLGRSFKVFIILLSRFFFRFLFIQLITCLYFCLSLNIFIIGIKLRFSFNFPFLLCLNYEIFTLYFSIFSFLDLSSSDLSCFLLKRFSPDDVLFSSSNSSL